MQVMEGPNEARSLKNLHALAKHRRHSVWPMQLTCCQRVHNRSWESGAAGRESGFAGFAVAESKRQPRKAGAFYAAAERFGGLEQAAAERVHRVGVAPACRGSSGDWPLFTLMAL